jgi:tRNA pseudouridine55 synthase
MGRSKKGNPVSGWVIVDKPPGITSTAVVNKVKWAFQAQKAGHAGTLDPAATGVLAVALGEATKTVPYVTDAQKCYRFMVRFGAATDTDDAEGQITDRRETRPTDAEIIAALVPLSGNILQVPPQYSAVKVDGQRAYDLAREGAVMDLGARPLTVERLELLDRPDVDHALLEMVCGKGGYVRSIARDLGAALGCLGHVLWLRRLWSGPFDVTDAVSLDDIDRTARSDDILAYLRPLQVGLAGLPELQASATDAARLRHGNAAPVSGLVVPLDAIAWASHAGQPVAIGQVRHGTLFPQRVFVLAHCGSNDDP